MIQAPSPLATPGERAGVRGTLFAQGLHDRLKHSFDTQQRVIVPESHDAKAGGAQIPRALFVASVLISVMTAIQLDDQRMLHTAKIRVITRHRMLPAELHAQLGGTQARPQPEFRIGRSLAQ